MKEITMMPVRVPNGNNDIEVYEFKGGFCMTTEFLGQCIGYKEPKVLMAKLFRRHKAALEPHRFFVTAVKNQTENKLSLKTTYSDEFVALESDKLNGNKLRSNVVYSDRGRPSFFYDRMGIVKAFMLANTAQAREYGPKVIDYLETLEAKRIERIERYWFGKRPFWPEIRERVMLGQSFRMIAEAMGRSASSVRNAVSRMIEVGILQPLRAAQALTGRARSTVIRYHRKFSNERQLMLPGFDSVAKLGEVKS